MMNGGATHVGVATDHVIESLPQRSVARLQDRRGHRSRPAGRSFRCSKRRCRRARRRRLADGGVRGGRCAGVGGARGGARPARRARDHLHARQGPRAVRARHARRAAGSPAEAHHATRRASSRSSACRRVDSRLPGAGRRCRGRLSGAARLGREVGRGRAREVRPPRIAFRTDWRDVAGERGQRRGALRARSTRARPRAPVPRSGDAARSDIPLFDICRRAANGTGPRRPSPPLAARLDKAST